MSDGPTDMARKKRVEKKRGKEAPPKPSNPQEISAIQQAIGRRIFAIYELNKILEDLKRAE